MSSPADVEAARSEVLQEGAAARQHRDPVHTSPEVDRQRQAGLDAAHDHRSEKASGGSGSHKETGRFL